MSSQAPNIKPTHQISASLEESESKDQSSGRTRHQQNGYIKYIEQREHTSGTTVREFTRWKDSALTKADLSKKGSVDAEIHDLICNINSKPDYFTTSSCSGRIIVCSDDPLLTRAQNGSEKTNRKKQCTWYLVSHTPVDPSCVIESLLKVSGPSKLKFEPFVLHVQCRTLENAKLLHQVAMSTGFRNSGIGFGKGGKKIVAAVRATACLEVPLTDSEGNRLTNDAYVIHTADVANRKLEINFKMIYEFQKALRAELEKDLHPKQAPKPALEGGHVYRRKRRIVIEGPLGEIEEGLSDLDAVAALLFEEGP